MDKVVKRVKNRSARHIHGFLDCAIRWVGIVYDIGLLG